MFIEVQHWSGAGNRFVIIDHRRRTFDYQWNVLTPSLCQRTDLPVAEGLLVLLDLDRTNASCVYDFYNPDGTTGAMCGNGARCAVRHAVVSGEFSTNEIQLTLNGRSYTAKVLENDFVALRMSLYKELRLIDSWTYVNVGSHHVIVDAREIVQSIEEFKRFDLVQFAREKLDFYRNQVGISSLNLNLAYPMKASSVIHLRTYENGVFDETQACGTGAVSTAVAFWTRHLIETSSIQLIPKSERLIKVHLEIEEEKIRGMILEGDARQDAPSSYFDPVTMKYQ